MRMCLAIDGPAPALVTYEPPSFASVSGVPSRRVIGSREDTADAVPERWSSIVSVQRIAAGSRRDGGGRASFPTKSCSFHRGPRHAGLHDRVLALELGGEGAVALLQRGGPVVP